MQQLTELVEQNNRLSNLKHLGIVTVLVAAVEDNTLQLIASTKSQNATFARRKGIWLVSAKLSSVLATKVRVNHLDNQAELIWLSLHINLVEMNRIHIHCLQSQVPLADLY